MNNDILKDSLGRRKKPKIHDAVFLLKLPAPMLAELREQAKKKRVSLSFFMRQILFSKL